MKLYEAVRALLADWPDRDGYTVLDIECMSGCGQACTVGLSAPGKPGYLFGGLDPTAETAAQALELVLLYRDSVDGVLPRAERPIAFRKGILARIPAATATKSTTGFTPIFDSAFRAQLLELIRWRRDVRRFRSAPIPEAVLVELLRLADLAPSVGLSQPWHFVTVDDPARRDAVRRCFEKCNAEALAEQRSDHAALYAKLKLAGLDKAPCHLAVFAEPDPSRGHGLGRRTMPETTAYSAVMAVHTLWLAARAAGIGLGWVSILDPATVTAVLDVPSSWTFIGYFCLGYPQIESDTPELQRLGWERRVTVAANRLRR
jgi:5,6-dimethylbenzimidazole synthase